MLAPLKGPGRKALLDMLTVKKERSQSPFNRHVKMPHAMQQAGRLVARFSFTSSHERLGGYVINCSALSPARKAAVVRKAR
jgi:hypothetical protein